MHSSKPTERERRFCIIPAVALVAGIGIYYGSQAIHQRAAEQRIAEATTTVAAGETALIVGNEDGSDGIPWKGTMGVCVKRSVLYPSFTAAQKVEALGNIATEGQDESDPYLVVDLILTNIDAQARYPLVDANQAPVYENGLNTSIFMLQGRQYSHLPLSVASSQTFISTWTLLLDVGEKTTLQLGFSIPNNESLDGAYLYAVTPLWRCALDIVNETEA